MNIKINDTTIDEDVLELIQDVFDKNNIVYSANDYTVVKTEDMLVTTGLDSANSYLCLAPVTTNSDLPTLRLPYERKDIGSILSALYPYFYDDSENTTVNKIIDQINESLKKAVVLKKNDFYDTFIVTDNGALYVVLYAHPNSLFFRGNSKVPKLSKTEPYHLSFCVKLQTRVV